MADRKLDLPKFTRNVYQSQSGIDVSAPAEVYRRPSPRYNPPRANLLNQTYSLYKRFKGDTNRNTTNVTNSSATKTSSNTTSKKYNSPNAVTNTSLPDVYVTGTRRNTTNAPASATTKPATTAATANNTSSQKQTTTPATRRTNATRRPARLANRNESTVNGNSIKIKAGDTLYAIAKRLTGDGNNYKEFLKYNNIKDPNKIYAGDNLVIPEKFRKIKSNAERRNAAHEAERLRRVKERANFALPDLDADYAQLQPREGGRRTLETVGGL